MSKKSQQFNFSLKNAKISAVVSGFVSILASYLAFMNLLDLWISAVIIVIGFPAFVLSVLMILRSSGKEGDYPFVGY